MRVKIGITPQYDEEKNKLRMVPGYMEGIELAGGLPLMLPLTRDEAMLEELCQELDGFLFTGGHDVNPGLYGQPVLECCQEISEKRDFLEHFMLKRLLQLNKPVFGICRGFQLMNVVLGGTLYQDLTEQMPKTAEGGPIRHWQEPPFNRSMHAVSLIKGTRLQECLGVEELPVNSLHHQGIHQLAPGAVANAYAPDGLIEGIELPGPRLAMAVQWHPELMGDEASGRLFSLLVEAASGGR
jgi:putative glutamine amidotransferase